jgi:hypothetical protein
MRRRLVRTVALYALGAVSVGASLHAQQVHSKRDADSFDKKLTVMLDRGASTVVAPRALRTTITEAEINSYLKFHGAEILPVGVVNPIITIFDTARVGGTVSVDMDAVRKSKERAWSDPLAYATGIVEIRLAVKLKTAKGSGTFELESATLGGVPIPKAFLQAVVAYYTTTPDLPNGFNLDSTFTLPQRIQQVDLQRGLAVIVQ